MRKQCTLLFALLMLVMTGFSQTIVITEINFNDPSGGNFGDTLEYLEIYNTAPGAIDLSGYQFTAGITFTFPAGSFMNGNEYQVICKNTAIFQAFYSAPGTVYQWNTGQALSNNGEALVLRDPGGMIVDSVRYYPTAPWPTGANGTGPSMQLCDPSLDNNVGANWIAASPVNAVIYGSVAGLVVYGTPNQGCVIAPPYIPFFASFPYDQNFEDVWLNGDNFRDVPTKNWKNMPASGNMSWRQDADGATAAWTNAATGVYTPTGANGTSHSARFHTAATPGGTGGNLDLYIDLSPAGTKQVDFWAINPNGMDSLTLYVSQDSGHIFNFLQKFVVLPVWTKNTISLGAITTPYSVIRFRGISDGGTSDIGLDEISVRLTPDVDAGLHAILNPTASLNSLSDSVKVTVRNYGSQPLTDVEIGWSINGVVQTPFNWSGSLASFAISSSVNLGLATYTAGIPNIIKVWTSSPNGMPDPDPLNDTLTKTSYYQEYAPLPFFEGFDSTWVDKLGVHDIPNLYWTNDPATGSPSWRRNDDGATANWTLLTTGAYTPGGASGTANSARFHTSGCTAGSVGTLQAYVDLSVPGEKELRFWHINTAGQDSLAVWMSTDGGTTFNFLAKWSVQATWAQRVILLGNVTSPTCVFRFRCTSNANGNTDPGIDQVSITMVEPDITVTKLVAPVSGCNLADPSDIVVRVKNVGNKFGVNIPITSNAGTFILSDTLHPGDSLDFTAGSISIAPGATELITVYSAQPGDPFANNDTLRATVKHSIPINTFPFLEDFESGSSSYFNLQTATNSRAFIQSGYGNDGSTGVLLTGFVAGSWPNNSGTTTTPAQAFGYTDHFSAVTSSCLVDATGLSAPELRIDLRQSYSSGWAYAYFRVVVNDTAVLTDQNAVGNFNPQTQNADPFVTHVFDLSAFANTQFKLTLQGANKYNAANAQSGIGDNTYIDNIIIKQKPDYDASLNAIVSPVDDCGLDQETVSVVIQNNGVFDLSNIPVSYILDGGAAVTEIYAGPLTSGQSVTFTFATPADLSVPGSHAIECSVQYPGDLDPSNDTREKQVFHTPFITSYPYTQDFEGNQTGWHSAAVSGVDEWAMGTPSKPTLNSAFSGTNAWVTHLTDNYADNSNSCVYSPCFDFSTIAAPILSVWLQLKTELNYDGMILEASQDGGPWTKVTGTGFYNNTSNNGPLPAPKWSGNNTTWTKYSTSVSQYAGQTKVQFRFRFASDYVENDEGVAMDDFSIYPASPDLVIQSVTSPFSGCELTAAESVQAIVKNAGPMQVVGFTMRYSIDNLPYVTETVPDTLDPGEEYLHTFATPVNLAGAGLHLLTVGVYSPEDLIHQNDSTDMMVFNTMPISNPPVIATFEDPGYLSLLGFADYSNSRISVPNGVGVNGGHAVVMTGGNNGIWPSGSGNTTTAAQAFGYDDHLATLYSCLVTISPGAAWALTMDLKQTYNEGPKHSWVRAMMNDTEYLNELVSNDSVFNPVTANADPFVTRLFLLDATLSPMYLSVQSSCRNDEAHSLSGIGDKVIIDNLGIVIVEGMQNPDATAMLMYPNPAQDKLNLQFAGSVNNARLEVIAVTGQVLYQQNLKGASTETLDISLFPAGVYTLRLISGTSVQSLRFIKD